MKEVFYLYGFVPASAPPPPRDLPGVDEAAVEDLKLDEFRAVFSRVESSSYQPERIEASLRDLGWVAQRGLAHERVVAWFVDHAQILPVPLFTLYSSADALRDAARQRAAEVREQLQRLAGLHEWDLKVAYDSDTLAQHAGDVSETIAALDDEIAAAPPGRRYLLEKKRAGIVGTEVAAAARREAGTVIDVLRPLAREVRPIALPQSERELPVVLYAAVLLDAAVADHAADEVKRRASALAPLGIRVDYSGPWAPYRFLESRA